MPSIVNTEQAQARNGYEGSHWAQNQARWDAVNAGFNEPLLTAAAIDERDRVLDVGCGAGCTTRLALEAPESAGHWARTCRAPCWGAHGRPHSTRTSQT